jgi:hypothetical protein
VRRLDHADELVLATVAGPFSNGAAATRWPLDVVHITRFAATSDTTFWDRVARSASELEVGPLVAEMLELCASDLGADVPAAAIGRLRAGSLNKGLAQRWTFGRYGMSLEWRTRQYRRIQIARGAHPTFTGYIQTWRHGMIPRRLQAVATRRLRWARIASAAVIRLPK